MEVKAHSKRPPGKLGGRFAFRRRSPLDITTLIAYVFCMWAADQITVEISEGDRDVAVFVIATPDGSLEVCAIVVEVERILRLIGVHIQSDDFTANSLWPHKLRMIADALMKEFDYDAIEIEGAPRTTGAGKGRTPKPIRFARRDRAAP